MNEQQTLSTPVVFEGVGLHTGQPARVVVMPAAAGSGLQFCLNSRVTIPALVDYVVDTSRATVLGAEGESVSTIEHLLSALVGLNIDNALINVEGPEIPVLDGSAAPFATAFMAAGLTNLHVARRFISVKPLELEEKGMRLSVVPADALHVVMDVDFRPPIGKQVFDQAIDSVMYAHEIAGARTFGYLDEVEALRARGLALGGSLDNAVVFDANGPLQALRFSDEPVRHKVLDLLGDFALVGGPLKATIHAYKSGHALHAQAARALRAGMVAAA